MFEQYINSRNVYRKCTLREKQCNELFRISMTSAKVFSLSSMYTRLLKWHTINRVGLFIILYANKAHATSETHKVNSPQFLFVTICKWLIVARIVSNCYAEGGLFIWYNVNNRKNPVAVVVHWHIITPLNLFMLVFFNSR